MVERVPSSVGAASAPLTQRLALPAWLGRGLVLIRPLPLLLVLAWLFRPAGERRETVAALDLERAFVLALADRSVSAEAGDVHVIDRQRGALGSRFHVTRALIRAHRPDEPSDIYLASAKLSPEGRLLSLDGLYDLSDTSAVDEQNLVVSGERAAWVIAGAGKTYTLKLADLHAEPPPSGPGWSRLSRWQASITNLQETGQRSGVGIRSFRLDPAATTLTLAFDGVALDVNADGNAIRLYTDGSGKIDGRRHLEEQVGERARPGNVVTWAVDRVRALPWFGSDRMQLVKAVAFDALDWFQRLMGKVTGDTGASGVKEQLGELVNKPIVEYTDPETGWPPPPMEPMLSPALEGEGKWRALSNDPYILENPGAPAPFIQSFIRTDPKRAYTQIWVVMWDPRQVALHEMSGTVEPKSATGETGPGLVPRKPEVIGRLLGGFNGGFQATHGEFGMMADGVMYLPPKPYSATVAELADGTTAFGTWPKNDAVPDNFVSFRQNMTPLVMDDALNPYKRNWWGGVPPGWTDESRTVRSGVCLTKENFVAYFYGTSIDADHLMLAMQRARCVYGIHLDMNPGHTGFEFYRTGKDGTLPDVGHKLDSLWEAEGPISGMDGWRFIGRRMLRYMGLMNFPRYVGREARDFFYLTLRPVLPGNGFSPKVKPAEPAEGEWKVHGLPQHGWPYALATAFLRPDPKRAETKVLLLEIDPRAVRVAPASESDAKLVVTLPPATSAKTGLFLRAKQFSIGASPPAAGATRLASGRSSPTLGTVAALGIDGAGNLVYAEVATARNPTADGLMLERLLAERCPGGKLFFEKPLGVALGGDHDLEDHPVSPGADAVRLARGTPPGAARIFPDTPLVPVSVWYPLQAKRVRYFHQPKPAEGGAGAAGDEPATSPGSEPGRK
jgi:hypothetical protein